MRLPVNKHEEQLKEYKDLFPEWVFYSTDRFAPGESFEAEDPEILPPLEEEEVCPVSESLTDLIAYIRSFDFTKRSIRKVIHHCTATPQTTKPGSITRYWRENLGWKNPGYHILIGPEGTYTLLQPFELPANGVRFENSDSIHISYIGGVDKGNKPVDNRTPFQRTAMDIISKELQKRVPDINFFGHKDFSNKACPSYNIRREHPGLFL